MNHKQLFFGARWLSPSRELDAALFRSEIEIKEDVKNAEITICGLGYFILYINGVRVGRDEFVPAYSDYHDRPNMSLGYPLNDVRLFRTYVMKYDVAKYLKKGKNVLGVMLGGGFYHQTARLDEGKVNYGDIKLCYRLVADGEEFLSKKQTVRVSSGFFKSSNLFYGETLDFTGFDRKWATVDGSDEGWEVPCEIAAPKTEYYIQSCPTDRAVETLKPELVKNFGDYSVYKIEKNISGYPVISCNKAGETVRVECTEELCDDLTLDHRSVGWGEQKQIVNFVTDNEKLYHPQFCWFGFRYFSVTNNARPVEVRVIHADVAVTSEFECSDKTLNWYRNAFVNTQLCNMHGGIPSDCPHRERLGYTGDGQLTCNAVFTQLDAQSFYRKWIADICDCQDIYTGHVQHTAPFAGGGGGPAGWGGAIINVPYFFYRHYGDKTELARAFPNMKKFVEYMVSRTENGLIAREEEDGWCLGDWCTPSKIEIPEEFVNTTLFITQLKRMVYCAEALCEPTKKYFELIEKYSAAVTDKYFDCETGSFINDLQGADFLAYDCGLGDERTLKAIVEKYSKRTEFDTGIFGTDILLKVLFESGNGELAVALLANKNEVSFDYMRRNGATTLWENWNGEASHSHPMFGASTEFLFEYILGIRQTEGSVCYDEIRIAPVFSSLLDHASGKITTSHGEISVLWQRNEGKIDISVDLCENIDAVLELGGKAHKLCAGCNKFSF